MKLRLSIFVLCIAFVVPSAAQAAMQGPSGEAFYDAPAKAVRGKTHGKLIWQSTAPAGIQASSAAATKNVLYVTSIPGLGNQETSGTVMLPQGTAPAGGWPLIIFNHGTTGMADNCAPSKGLPELGGYADYFSLYNHWLDSGFAVAVPDYQGLGTPGTHRYLDGIATARSSLDIFRAAKSLYPSIGSNYTIFGHSQGGQAAIFAASIAKTWLGPKAKLKGTVAYAPPSSFDVQAKAIGLLGSNPSALTGLATLIVKAANIKAKTNPQAVMSPRIFDASDAVLARDGSSLWDEVGTDMCMADISSRTGGVGGLAPNQFLTTGDWANNAVLKKIEPVLKSMNPAKKVTGPLWVGQGTSDGTVLAGFTASLSAGLEALNAGHYTYKTYPGATHSSVLSESLADTDALLADWF